MTSNTDNSTQSQVRPTALSDEDLDQLSSPGSAQTFQNQVLINTENEDDNEEEDGEFLVLFNPHGVGGECRYNSHCRGGNTKYFLGLKYFPRQREMCPQEREIHVRKAIKKKKNDRYQYAAAPLTSAMWTETVLTEDSAGTTSADTAGGAGTTCRPRYQTDHLQASLPN